AKPQLVLKIPHKVGQEQVEEIRLKWDSAHQGLDRAHRLAVLTQGTDLDVIPVSNEDAQFLGSREFELKTVANIVGVPPHKLGANITSSYASLEAENKAFLSDSIEKWLIRIEEEFD